MLQRRFEKCCTISVDSADCESYNMISVVVNQWFAMERTMLTQAHESYVSRRIHCPATVDDVLQRVAIDLWKRGDTDAALVWTIVRRRTVDAQRTAIAREAHCRSYLDDCDLQHAAAPDSTFSVESEELLQLAGEYASDVRLWCTGERGDSAFRGRVLRVIKRIRERAGE